MLPCKFFNFSPIIIVLKTLRNGIKKKKKKKTEYLKWDYFHLIGCPLYEGFSCILWDYSCDGVKVRYCRLLRIRFILLFLNSSVYMRHLPNKSHSRRTIWFFRKVRSLYSIIISVQYIFSTFICFLMYNLMWASEIILWSINRSICFYSPHLLYLMVILSHKHWCSLKL